MTYWNELLNQPFDYSLSIGWLEGGILIGSVCLILIGVIGLHIHGKEVNYERSL